MALLASNVIDIGISRVVVFVQSSKSTGNKVLPTDKSADAQASTDETENVVHSQFNVNLVMHMID